MTPANQTMGWVLIALTPGIAAMSLIWGLGVLWNVAILSVACVIVEITCTSLIGQRPSLKSLDASALVTAWLIAICLPPAASAHLLLVAALASIALAKHAYGGLGQNVFNPAMVGYAVILVSFPQHLDHWPALDIAFDPTLNATPDALTGATLLTEFRYRTGLTNDEFVQLYGSAYAQQKYVVYAFLAGGVLLMLRKIIHWRIPLAMTLGMGFCAMLGYSGGDSTSYGSAWLHWMSGGFVAAALFVATDPATSPMHKNHQWIYGVIIGLTAYVIRAFGSYPDGLAFAILLANCTVPFLNRIYFHNAELARSNHA